MFGGGGGVACGVEEFPGVVYPLLPGACPVIFPGLAVGLSGDVMLYPIPAGLAEVLPGGVKGGFSVSLGKGAAN